MFFVIDDLLNLLRNRPTKVYFSTSIEQQKGILSYVSYGTTTGDNYDMNAFDYISWNPKTPVLIRNDNSKQGNYPPILVQTFLRQIVENNGNKIAIKYKEGTTVKSLTYFVSTYAILAGVPSCYIFTYYFDTTFFIELKT